MENTGKLAGTNTNKTKSVVVYDISLLPLNMNVEDVMKKFKEIDVIVYDSSKGGPLVKSPYIVEIKDEN